MISVLIKMNIQGIALSAMPFILQKIYRSVIIVESAVVSLDSKVLLNIKEASDLFGIGQHRLRAIVREDYGNKYHLMLGRTIKIKRKQFEEFIDNVEQI